MTEKIMEELDTMQAFVRDDYGPPTVLALERVARPSHEDNELLVRVAATSVNPLEWHVITGQPLVARIGNGLLKPKRRILGSDLAGRVEAVGPAVTGFEVGDEVFGEATGTYAELVKVTEDSIARKPANLTMAAAGSVAIAAITALQGLDGLQSGERVLINGASGGVGTFAVQIAKARGAHVTAVCSTRNVEMVRGLGADRIIDYTNQSIDEAGAEYDLFLDAVGHRALLESRRTLNRSGRYVAVGVPKSIPVLFGWMIRMATISLVGRRRMRPLLAKINKDDLLVLRDLLESGAIEPVIERTYDFAAIPDALRRQGEGHAQGKTVITVSGQDS